MRESEINSRPRIAVIGGGTGNFTTLTGLKPLVGDGLTAIPSIFDDGGSSGVLRDNHGVLPAGDARQCLVALSNASQVTRDMFNERLSPEEGFGPDNQSFGNLAFYIAEKVAGNFPGALKALSEMLDISGTVAPVSHDNRRLVFKLPDGKVIRGEHAAEISGIKSFEGAQISYEDNAGNESQACISEEAEQAILDADITVLAPGSLYTSRGAVLAVRGMRETLSKSHVVMCANLMSSDIHTYGFDVAKEVKETQRIIGANVIQTVIYNNARPSREAIERYRAKGEELARPNMKMLHKAGYNAVGLNLLSDESNEPTDDPNDALASTRSYVRHDPRKLGGAIMAEFFGRYAR